MTTSIAPAGRPLGPSETVLWALDAACPANAVVIARLKGPLNQGALESALARLQKKHPLLQMKVVHDTQKGKPGFSSENVPPIPLRWLNGSPDGIHEIAETEFRTPVRPSCGPLIRCTAISHDSTTTSLVLTVNHAILDGLSSYYLMEDICLFLGDPDMPEPTPLLMPLENYLPDQCRGLRGTVRYIFFCLRLLWSFLRHGKPVRLNGKRTPPPENRIPRFVSRHIEPELFLRLSQAAKRNGTTIHGALSAALLVSIRSALDIAGSRTLCMASLTNIRKDLNIAVDRSIGLFVSSLPTLHPAQSNEEFWTLARQVRKKIKKGRDRLDDLLLVPCTNHILQYASRKMSPLQFARFAERANFGTFGISNVGLLEAPRAQGPVSLESFNAVVSPSVLNPLLVTVCTRLSRMTLNFIYMQPVLTGAEAGLIADGMIRELLSAVQPAPAPHLDESPLNPVRAHPVPGHPAGGNAILSQPE